MSNEYTVRPTRVTIWSIDQKLINKKDKLTEEEKKENATKESVASTTPLGGIGFYDEPEPEQVQIKIVNKPAVTMLEGQLTSAMMEELNSYVDDARAESSDYSSNLVGQIKQTEKSQQLTMDMNAPVVKGLINILAESGRKFLSTYSEDLQLKIEGDENFSKAPIDCHSIWTVHSYAGDYNPLHDHGCRTEAGLSMILYLKVPECIQKLPDPSEFGGGVDINHASGVVDGYTYFTWGNHNMRDVVSLKPVTEEYVKPEAGTLILFPNWLRHSVNPFFGEGERRTFSANVNLFDNNNFKIKGNVFGKMTAEEQLKVISQYRGRKKINKVTGEEVTE